MPPAGPGAGGQRRREPSTAQAKAAGSSLVPTCQHARTPPNVYPPELLKFATYAAAAGARESARGSRHSPPCSGRTQVPGPPR